MADISPSEWERFLNTFENPHILQSFSWGQLKSEFGWQVVRLATQSCCAQILVKQVLPGIRFAYIPKGPVGANWQTICSEVDAVCRQQKCVFLKIEPDLSMMEDQINGMPGGQPPIGFIHSIHSIQPMRTLIVDLTGDEQQILGRMKQKTRYNINLAIKKNVVIKPHSDLGFFYHLMEITGQRDQFGIHSLAYYQRAFDLFFSRDQCQLLVAEFEGNPIAALIAFRYGKRAWYFYGASANAHRDKMPNYLLQWEAMRWARSQGCTEYDLWGVPDADLDTLEANLTKKNTGLWGVYRFKRGFGGKLLRSAGPWDRVYKPFPYRLYTMVMKLRAIKS